MLTFLPELNAACMVTVSNKIKQKKMCIHMQLYLWNMQNWDVHRDKGRGACACIFWSGGTEQCFVPGHPTPCHLPYSCSSMATATKTSGF